MQTETETKKQIDKICSKIKSPRDIKTKTQIKKIMSEMKCKKNFECYKTDFQGFDKNVKIWKSAGLIECFKKNPQKCDFSFSFGNSFFCKCPLLNYAFVQSLH